MASILGLMELSLSFDNAVVNATVLKNMSTVWQRRFLTWGMIIAVFGVRFLLPVAIVSVVSGQSLQAVALMVFGSCQQKRIASINLKTAVGTLKKPFVLSEVEA